MEEKQRQYKITGIVMFIIASLLLWMRVLVAQISPLVEKSNMAVWAKELLLDFCFTIPLQVGILFLLTFFIYKTGLKKSTKEVFEMSGFVKPEGKKIVLAVIMGFFVYFGTIGVSAVWQAIIDVLGYTSTSSGMILPEKFNVGVFLASLFLTAIVPAFCEEFAMRGIFVRTLDNSFSDKATIIIGGLAFGLFHQYIEQIFYTALFGMLIVFIVLRTRCIWYGVIIHFINNGLSVFLTFSNKYDFAIGKQFYDVIDKVSSTNTGVMLLYAAFGLSAIMAVVLAKAIAQKKKPVFDENGKMIFGKRVYRPAKKDSVWYIGAIVMTALVTIFTFMFGYLL